MARYRNPVIAEPWADPAIAGPDEEGWWWCYATDDEHEPPPPRRFKVARSRDLVTWQTHPPGAEAGAIAAPIRNATRFRACWAPDVRRLGTRWLLYGSLKFDDHTEQAGHGIFVAESGGPTGFGAPRILERGPGFTTIDPGFHEDSRSGRRYLYWGSGGGPILARELAADGLGFAACSAPHAVLHPDPDDPVGRLWEGAHVIARPGDLRPVLLVSGADTWRGPYRVHAFLGDDPLGAFTGGVEVLRENAAWQLCGQCFALRDTAGQDWLAYHAMRGEAVIPGTEDVWAHGRLGVSLRQMCLDRLVWGADGMPRVQGGSPSTDWQAGPEVDGGRDRD
ncbi:glycoside hydrolase family 43 protein [Falsiroseomonas oryziterrae]|uniref:glycoside hydrolase family 43 protein n=1 Tax=Falsiroseomonas oryziterrae TaxID=2911368 RepID=UPI001F01D24C|nr:family 43 glycosylhydrolase [Roseomonas sp. NPKOSM-4]